MKMVGRGSKEIRNMVKANVDKSYELGRQKERWAEGSHKSLEERRIHTT